MLTTDECFYIGYVKKAHGLDGELEILLDVDDPSKYRKKESVLLEVKNNLIPFFVETLQIRRQSAFIKFRNINTPQEFEPLIGSPVYLPLSELPPLKGKKQFYYHEVIGFEVVDKTKGAVGILKGIQDNLHQPVLEIMQGEKEVLIPLVDEFLEKIDRNEKKLFLDTPEGLIDLYLDI